MTIEEHKESGYITLKEASERFGYAPDYIGQLIRKGKIDGKQVYANVAWMTTAEAMERYVAGGGSESAPKKLLDRAALFLSSPRSVIYAKYLFRSLVGAMAVVLIGLFYMLSVAVDHHLSRKEEERLQAKLPDLSATLSSLPSASGDLFGNPSDHAE